MVVLSVAFYRIKVFTFFCLSLFRKTHCLQYSFILSNFLWFVVCVISVRVSHRPHIDVSSGAATAGFVRSLSVIFCIAVGDSNMDGNFLRFSDPRPQASPLELTGWLVVSVGVVLRVVDSNLVCAR